MGESELIDTIRSHKYNDQELLQELIGWERSRLSTYKQKSDFLEEIKWFQQSKTFHNSPIERLFSIINTLSQDID